MRLTVLDLPPAPARAATDEALLAGKPMVQHVYEAARRSRLQRVVVATDDERIVQAGAGATLRGLSLGGRLDGTVAGGPLIVTAEVVTVTDGRFRATPGSAFDGGMRDLGPLARVRVGNVDVLVNGYVRQQCFDAGAFRVAFSRPCGCSWLILARPFIRFSLRCHF